MKKRTSARSLGKAVRAEHNRRRQIARAKARAVRLAQHLISKQFKHKPYTRWWRLSNRTIYGKRRIRFPRKETLAEKSERFRLELHFKEASKKFRKKLFESNNRYDARGRLLNKEAA